MGELKRDIDRERDVKCLLFKWGYRGNESVDIGGSKCAVANDGVNSINENLINNIVSMS